MALSYFTRYADLAFERTDDGVLSMRFHTDGGPITFTGGTHEDLPKPADPDQALLEFLQSTREAAAELGHWDRTCLEVDPGRWDHKRLNHDKGTNRAGLASAPGSRIRLARGLESPEA